MCIGDHVIASAMWCTYNDKDLDLKVKTEVEAETSDPLISTPVPSAEGESFCYLSMVGWLIGASQTTGAPYVSIDRGGPTTLERNGAPMPWARATCIKFDQR